MLYKTSMSFFLFIIQKYFSSNYEKYNLTGQVLNLFLKSQQFESHKSQGYWRLTWSLISGLVKLIEIRTI
jgi:hypothetical protein